MEKLIAQGNWTCRKVVWVFEGIFSGAATTAKIVIKFSVNTTICNLQLQQWQ